MADVAESWDPSDDDEIPGQHVLWEPPAARRGVQLPPPPMQAPAFDDELAQPAVQEPPRTRPTTATRSSRPRPARTRVSVSPAGRGVTGRGVVVLVTVFTALVGVIDVIASGHRGHLFGVAFVLAAVAGAYLVRRRDLLIAVVAPPLIYCALILFMSLIDSGGTTGSLTTRVGVYIGDAFVTGAPSIWVGTAASAAVVWWRAGGTVRRLPPALPAWKNDRKRP